MLLGPRCGAPASRSPPVGAERAGDVILSESVDVPAGSEPVQVRRREFALLPAMAAITAATGRESATAAAENTSSTWRNSLGRASSTQKFRVCVNSSLTSADHLILRYEPTIDW